MIILVIANNDIGLYKFRKELLQKLIDDGNEVYISLPNGNLVQPMVDMGCKFIETAVDRRGINPVTDLKLFLNYRKMIGKVKPDFIITYTIKPNVYAGIVSAIKHKKYAINITGLGTAFQKQGFFLKLIVMLYKFACKKAHTVIFENCENMKLFLDYRIVKEEQCLLNAGAGVNLEEYPFEEYPPTDKIRFLFVGRIMQEKGIDELFDAAKRIKREYDNVEFDVVGMYEDNYEETVNRLVDDGIINFYGYQQDVKPFVKQSHCFVLPSWHEGMANTNLECGAMGRPIITSNIHGCLEAVVDGKTGYLVEKKNANDLYEKLKSFIELPYDEKVKMGQASHDHIAEVFDKKKVVSDTISVLM
ncbi:glycosyltransferase family 4 protein [uncultured Eubacterium sp.]|uniref:glycosyltransferase family 4 protein n=1 Tax=uncultured Eubacterium sp. TaxID=165185 RepID=UPI00258C1C82|nr:glycosyltransferase family 4 protein [uncultured Eubacterium sp.]